MNTGRTAITENLSILGFSKEIIEAVHFVKRTERKLLKKHSIIANYMSDPF